jgi:hypothetical protein
MPGNGGAAKRERGSGPAMTPQLATTALLFNFLVRPPHLPILGMNLLLSPAVKGYLAGGGISRWSHRNGSTRRCPQGSAAALAPASVLGAWSSQDCLYCLLNQVAPVIATAFRVHGFAGRVRNEPLLLKS